WMSKKGARTLLANTVRWAGKAKAPSVGLSRQTAELEKTLSDEGFKVQRIAPGDLKQQVDVYCFIGHENLNAEEIESLRRFAMKGGGVLVSTTPWAFGDRWPDFSQFPGNQITSLAGIEFQTDGYAQINGKISPAPVDAALPMQAVAKIWENPDSVDSQLLEDLMKGKKLAGAARVDFRKALGDLNEAVGPIIPTQKKPVKRGENPLIDTIIDLEDFFNQRMPAEEIVAIPAAADYPGEVPVNARRVSRTLKINGNYKGWATGRSPAAWKAKELRPTGLYAAPGDVITVSVPDKILDKGFDVVIGAYGGGLNNRPKWNRYPHLRRSFPIDDTKTKAANGLGGLVNIAIPQGADFGEIEITIADAVEAPTYIHGKTSIENWKSTIRDFPAPWAELASERMIIAIPSSYIRELNDPDKVMEAWNEIIDRSAELAMLDRDNYRAERIVFERQTAAGYMHSGYPVAAPQDKSAIQAVDADSLRQKGNWGFFHEYGHNHQHNLWFLPGTGETTCNLWSVYMFEEWVVKDRDGAHGSMDPLRRLQKRNAYFNNGRKFAEEWSVWTALDTYLLVQEEFGWEPFQKAFAEYNELPESEWPRNQQEKNDQWVLRLSKACERNLAPYWRAWNLPLSESVDQQLQDLPAWDDHPVKRYLK
ncbi:MAG: M60 family metallopeptidase, partial [Verrucomicrobiota bacterium]